MNLKILLLSLICIFSIKAEAQPPFHPSTEEIYALLEKKYDTNLADKFLEVRQQKEAFDIFIDSLRSELANQSGGYIEIDGQKTPKGKRDSETPHKLLITEGKGKAIEQKIVFLENIFLSLIENQTVRYSIRNKLPLKIDYTRPKEKGIDWAEYVFGQMPLAAVFPMLRKFQNDATSSEAVVLDYLLNGKN